MCILHIMYFTCVCRVLWNIIHNDNTYTSSGDYNVCINHDPKTSLLISLWQSHVLLNFLQKIYFSPINPYVLEILWQI